MRLRNWFDKSWRHAVACILPPSCPVCEELLPPLEPVNLCQSCYKRLVWWDQTGVLSPQLPKAIDAFYAPCLYESVLREALLKLKFHDATPLAAVLAKLMSPYVPLDAQLLVPVPMHAQALRRRWFNQAALLTAEVARRANKPYHVTTLKRIKPSDGQSKRTRAQRLKLSSYDFVATPEVAGKHIVLIDDVYTTGATARACALALKRAGATKVSVLTLAYTPVS